MNSINNQETSLSKDKILINRAKIGAEIRRIRENINLSQEQLADKMHVNRTTISKIESGKYNFSIDYLSKFAFYLDFDIVVFQKKL